MFLALSRRQHLDPEEGSAPAQRERLVVGLIGLPLLYFAFRVASPPEGARFFHLYLWARFATIGLWVSYVVPKVVALLRARHENADASPAR